MILLFAVVAASGHADVVLIAAALSGDRDQQRRLALRLLPVIIAHVGRTLRSWVDRDRINDIAQEVWIDLMKDDGRFLRAYAPERGASLEHYVGMVARRTAGNQQRKSRAARRGGDAVVVPFEPTRDGQTEQSPEETTAARELSERLDEHLRTTLSARGLLVYRFLYTDSLSPDEAAAATGLSTQAVYNWQHRIRAAARAFLGAHA